MLSLLNDNINNGLLFIYGLIGIVIILIIIITVIDKIDNKKRKNKKSLADTLSMKPIKDDDFENTNIEILSMISKDKTKEVINLEEIAEVTKEENIPYIEEEVEDELEKTQAQIRVEEITKALEEAGVDEKIEQDKYAQFEQEQEKNAFISYEELKDNYDRLYEENEKTQYIDDNTIPINIKELYDAANIETNSNNNIETLDMEEDSMDSANSFLNDLKELRNNLN